MAPSIGQIAAVSYVAVLNKARKPTNQWADNSFMQALQEIGGIKRKHLGEVIEEALDWRRNPAAAFMSSDLQNFPVVKTEVLSAAQYQIGELSCPVDWSKKDDVMNPSENQKIAFVKALLENAFTTHDELIEEALFTASTNGFIGLPGLFPSSGQGSVGGISAVAEVFWRNPNDDYLADGSDMEAVLTEVWNGVAKGSGSKSTPKILVSGADAHALYESTLTPFKRYAGDDASGAFKKLAFKTARYIFSQYGGTDVFMFNPETTRLIVSADAFREKGETAELEGANGYRFKLYSALQFVTGAKSRGGVASQV